MEIEELAGPIAEEMSDNSDLEIVEIADNKDQARPNSGESIKQIRCPICLETPEIVAVAQCGHSYCSECVFSALSSANGTNQVNGKCSICRKVVRYDQTIYLEMKVKSKTN